jgi:hypothetical protein
MISAGDVHTFTNPKMCGTTMGEITLPYVLHEEIVLIP